MKAGQQFWSTEAEPLNRDHFWYPTAGCFMRFDHDVTFLVAEALKDADRRIAAAELICLLLDHNPAAGELDELEVKIARRGGQRAVAAYRELCEALGLLQPPAQACLTTSDKSF